MNRIISSLFLLCLIFRLPCNAQQERINLAGSWKFSLDSTKFDSEINLPGSTDEAGIGEKHIAGTKLYTLVSQEKINSLFSLYKLRSKLSKCQLTSSKSEGQR